MKYMITALVMLGLGGCQPQGDTTPSPTPSVSTPGASVSATPKASEIQLNTPFELALNESKTYGPEKLNLTYEALEDDSRCPKDATCVWAGEVKVRIGVSVGGQAQEPLRMTLGGAEESVSAQILNEKYELVLSQVTNTLTLQLEKHATQP